MVQQMSRRGLGQHEWKMQTGNCYWYQSCWLRSMARLGMKDALFTKTRLCIVGYAMLMRPNKGETAVHGLHRTSICKGAPGSRHQSTVDLTHPSNSRKPRTKWHERVTENQTTPPGVRSPSLCKQCVGHSTSHEVIYEQVLWEGAYGFAVIIRKESNHLKMLTRRQCFLLSYLRTLSDGPAEVWTYNLLHNSSMLHQLMSYWSCVTVIRTMGLC